MKKIDRNYAKDEFLNLAGYERGFVFTVKELFLRPGQSISDYMQKDRTKLTKPVTFLILSSVIYTLVLHYFRTNVLIDERVRQFYGDSSILPMMNWVQDNFGYANILMLVFIAFWIRIFFKKYQHNFYEITVVLCFVVGEGMLILCIDPIITKYFNYIIISFFVYSFAFLYISFAIGSFFESKFSNYRKAFFAYMLGMLSFDILVFAGAIIFDLIIKK